MSTDVPPLFVRMIDDAAVFPPGNAPFADAMRGHRLHRAAPYRALVGPLLLPAADLAEAKRHAPAVSADGDVVEIGLVGPLAAVARALGKAEPFTVRQIEVPVAKRGEDPMPGLNALLRLADAEARRVDVYAEIPLTMGLLSALDGLAEARSRGVPVAPKFRTGGLAAELFPTPMELAAVICACRDRQLSFKLTAGLHHALRHNDPETGFTHHGFLNVLAGALAAAEGAEVVRVAELLGGTDPVPLIELVRGRLQRARPLWLGFGSCSIDEPLIDLRRYGLLPDGMAA